MPCPNTDSGVSRERSHLSGSNAAAPMQPRGFLFSPADLRCYPGICLLFIYELKDVIDVHYSIGIAGPPT